MPTEPPDLRISNNDRNVKMKGKMQNGTRDTESVGNHTWEF